MIDHSLVVSPDVTSFPLGQLPAERLGPHAIVTVLSAPMREYGYSVVGKHEIRSLGDIGMLVVRNVKGDEGGFKNALKPGVGRAAIQKWVAISIRVSLTAQKQPPLSKIGPKLLIASA